MSRKNFSADGKRATGKGHCGKAKDNRQAQGRRRRTGDRESGASLWENGASLCGNGAGIGDNGSDIWKKAPAAENLAPESADGRETRRKGTGGGRLREYADDIRQAVEVMSRGGVIVYPTDTIWGIGCDACNPEAVRKVYEIKRRSDAKALITLVDSVAKVQFYVREMPDVAWDLVELSTDPLTVIYDGARNLAPNLLAEDGSAAIRVTREEFSRNLCMRMRRAIVSTSANISGTPAPKCFADISPEILEAVDYVCTSRREETHNPPASSIVKLGTGGEVQIIRGPGASAK